MRSTQFPPVPESKDNMIMIEINKLQVPHATGNDVNLQTSVNQDI